MSNNKPTIISEQSGPTGEKHGFIPGIAGATVLLIVGALLIWWTVQRTDRSLRRDLLEHARLAAQSLNIDDVASISGTDADLDNPAYQRLKQQLAAVKQAEGKCRFAYLMGQKTDGSIFFFADSEPPDSEDYSPPGQIYEEASADLVRVFSTKAEFVEGPQADRWGTWVSALIPLCDPQTDRPIALMGMDIDARKWRVIILAAAAWPLVLAAAVMAMLFLSYALARSRRRALDQQAALRQNREMLDNLVAHTEKQRRQMESLLDAIPAPVFFKDKNDRYLGCNPAFEAITGTPKADLIGKRPHDIWPEKYSSTYQDKDMALLKAGGKQQYEFKYAGADGAERDVIFYKAAFRDQAGETDGIVGVMLDITGRKLAEADQERLLSAIEQSGEVIIITDPEGMIQYVNRAFEAVTGYARDEVFGQNPRILKSGRQDESFYRQLWTTISGGKVFQGRMVNKRKDGTLYTEEATISPVRNKAGKIVSYVAVKRDITEHIRLTAQLQQAQKMETVGRLAGGVAHDFNNMLNVIIGNAEMALQQTREDDPLHESLEEIFGAARRSAETTRQLLAFARKQTITPEVIDVNAVVEGRLNMLRRLIGEDVDLAWQPGAGLWTVNLDPSQIDQILVHLCVNAQDAISGMGRITIETSNVSPDKAFCADHSGLVPGDYVLLTVSDSGRGMDKQTLDKLFEPFFTTKGMAENAGLGLATVYGIVKQNNGYVYADSRPQQGTTFRIYLPRHAGQVDQKDKTPGTSLSVSGQNKTVLVVDDEASIPKSIRRILERLDYIVLTATGASSALQLTEDHPSGIDLLITDVIMPEMNGRELADRLKIRYPGLKTLFMSGYTADIIGQKGIVTTDVHFIQKPFSNQVLAEKVREALAEEQA